MNLSFLVKNNKLTTVLRKKCGYTYYGYIDTYLKNTPTITKHYIKPFYQNSGYGTLLLNYTERLLFKEYDKITLNIWCIDKYHEDNINYYIKNGYIKNPYFDKNNTVCKVDEYKNNYYQIFLHKNKIDV